MGKSLDEKNTGSYVFGIDGGGSKTEALLVAPDGSVLAFASSGASNPILTGADRSCAVIIELLRECCTSARCETSEVGRSVIGLAGIGREQIKIEMFDSLLSQASQVGIEFNNLILETDVAIAIDAALPGMSGIVLIAGTGSIALYRSPERKLFRAGGWGRILGDEGSGYSLGVGALRAVMKAFDHSGEPTELTRAALRYFKLASPDELVLALKSDDQNVASFAPEVIECASTGDRAAQRIIESNAASLLELVRALVQQRGLTTKVPVALLGGLLEHENYYSKLVRKKIQQEIPQASLQLPKFPAVFGAVIKGLHAFE